MIIKALCNVVYSFFELLVSAVNLPSISDKLDLFMDYIDLFLDNAAPMVNLFLPWSIVEWGLPLIAGSFMAVELFVFIMWVLKKIPMLGIK